MKTINTNRTCYNAYYVPLKYVGRPNWSNTRCFLTYYQVGRPILTRREYGPVRLEQYSLPKGTFDFVLLEGESE